MCHGAKTPHGSRPLTPLEIIYADSALLVMHKPAGLLSVPGKGPDKQDCLSRQVQQLYPEALVVHRLDMATSGLMLMARTPTVQQVLNQAFAARTIHKRYVAVVNGCLSAHTGHWQCIDLPIALDWPNRPRRIISLETGKPSQTRWQVLYTDTTHQQTRVLLEPITGRSHQLRVHLLAIGHAIVGDRLYAPEIVAFASERLLLHAHSLEFVHPLHGQTLRFESPVPF